MSLPTTGEQAGNSFAPAATAAPAMSRVDWALVPRVNLLPPEISADRKLRGTQRWLAAAVVVTVLLGGLTTYWAEETVSAADAQLKSAQAETAKLNAQKAQYAEIPRINAQIDEAEELRQSAMATHVRWYEYLNDLAQATPTEVTLTSVNVAVSSGATAGAPAASSDPLAPAGIGAIAFQASSVRYPDVARWLDRMNAVPGFANASVSQLDRDEKTGEIKFNGTVTVTNEALSHDFDRKMS